MVHVVALGGDEFHSYSFGFRGGPNVGVGDDGLDAVVHDLARGFDERVHHLRLGNHAHNLTLDEEVAAAASRGDPEVRLARLARSIDHTAHHRHLQRNVQLTERGHRVAGDLDDVHLGPTATGARNEVEAPTFAQAQRFEQGPTGARFLHRIGSQRVPDRVADAFGQKGGDPGRRLHEPRRRRTGLGHPEVQRVVHRLGQQPVRVDHQRDVAGLDRDLDVVEINLGEVGEFTLRRRHQRLGRDPVLLGDVGIQGAGVHADPNRQAAILRFLRDDLDL